MKIPAIGVCLLAMALVAPIAQAHRLILSVWVSAGIIEGELGFSNGEMAAEATVQVVDTAGDNLGTVQTDAEGMFRYRPDVPTLVTFRADLGAGHVAQAELLPEDLQALGSDAPAGLVAPQTATPARRPANAAAPAVAWDEAAIARVVAREVQPLRRQIAEYQEKNDLQTLLGGIGYIIGLVGIGYYVAARKRLRGGAD
ncbi:MAG: cobalt ABC transporter permease [Pseudomonadota bacterium]